MERVPVLLRNGAIANLPLDQAHRLVAAGYAQQLGPLMECAMLAAPAPREYAPPKKPRKPRKPKR